MSVFCTVCKKEMDALCCRARCPFKPAKRPPRVKHPTKDEYREGRAA